MKVVSFSGIDGAGKSTQIRLLANKLTECGYSCDIYTMYFDLSFFAQLRKIFYFVSGLFKKKAISPKGLHTTDKSDQSLINTLISNDFIRALVFPLDVLFFNLFLIKRRMVNRKSITILDRCLYDQLCDSFLADLPGLVVFLPLVATPGPSFFLLVPPKTSFERKQEYDLVYLNQRVRRYERIVQCLSQSSKNSLLIRTEMETVEDTFLQILGRVDKDVPIE